MNYLPGWDSIDSTLRLHSFFELTGIVLFLVVVTFELLSYFYGHRHDWLVEQAQNATNSRYEAEIANLKAQQAERHLSERERKIIFAAMAPFRGQKVKITSAPGDWESDELAKEFYALAQKAQWDCINTPGEFETIYASGAPIGIEVTLNLADVKARNVPPATAAAYNSLMDALHQLGLVKPNEPAFANSGVDSGTIEIRVGTKPRKPGETSADIYPEKTIPLPKN
jgi:hypothetical protein